MSSVLEEIEIIIGGISYHAVKHKYKAEHKRSNSDYSRNFATVSRLRLIFDCSIQFSSDFSVINHRRIYYHKCKYNAINSCLQHNEKWLHTITKLLNNWYITSKTDKKAE